MVAEAVAGEAEGIAAVAEAEGVTEEAVVVAAVAEAEAVAADAEVVAAVAESSPGPACTGDSTYRHRVGLRLPNCHPLALRHGRSTRCYLPSARRKQMGGQRAAVRAAPVDVRASARQPLPRAEQDPPRA